MIQTIKLAQLVASKRNVGRGSDPAADAETAFACRLTPDQRRCELPDASAFSLLLSLRLPRN
jgi:hypothetical protein